MVHKNGLVLGTRRKLHDCSQELQRNVDAHEAGTLWGDPVQALFNRAHQIHICEGLDVSLWLRVRGWVI